MRIRLFIFYIVFTLLLSLPSLLFLSTSLYCLDWELPNIEGTHLNITERILNFLREEEDYHHLQNIILSHNKINIGSKDMLLDNFSILDKKFFNKKIFYEKILSFFKEKKLSFYNSNSYEQRFLKEEIEIFDDWYNISEKFMNIEIITDKNQNDINHKLKIKEYTHYTHSSIVNSHTYFLENNLVALIEGKDKKLKNEFIVIGMNLKHRDSSIYSSDINQVLTVSVFLKVIENILNNKDKLKRSVMFVVFSDENFYLPDYSSFFRTERLNKDFNGAKAFLDYFNYYNNHYHNNTHSIYTFIDIEQLSFNLFLNTTKNLPKEFQLESNYSTNYLNFLKIIIKNIDTLNHINYITNNESLDSIFRISISNNKFLNTVHLSNKYLKYFNLFAYTYNLFKNQGITSLLLGTHPLSIHPNYKITKNKKDMIIKYLDLNKIDEFIKTILVNTMYLSIRNPEFDLSQIKNPCSIYFD